MKRFAAAAMLAALAACSKSDDVRESVAAPKAGAVSSAPVSEGRTAEVPNSADPDDAQLGGGIRH